MENNKRKIKIKHRIMATICLALFCGAVFIAHYKPFIVHADNDDGQGYSMPSGVSICYSNNNTVLFAYPMYATTPLVDNDFYSGIINPVNGNIEWLATNHLSAPDNSYLAVLSSWLVPPPVTLSNFNFNMIEIVISEFYSTAFNNQNNSPIAINIKDDSGNNVVPLCDVYITYDVWNFTNDAFQQSSQVINNLDLNEYGILVNRAFTADYFISSSNKMLHCRDISILVVFDETLDVAFNNEGLYVSVELNRASNSDIGTFNRLIHEHTWEEVIVTVDYLESFVNSVNSFLQIEILPNFTFGIMLELAIAIPLVVWFLKSWLGG